LLDQYCVGCHNDRLKSGGLALNKIDVTKPTENAETWEKVIRKLRSGLMPPAGARRPAATQLNAFAASLETSIDQVASARPNPGKPSLHRLNRAEYQNTVRDLLALDVDVTSLLPADDTSVGFDNIADVLNVSPALLEGYERAASKISHSAVGDANITPYEETYHIPQEAPQLKHVDGAPFGTRGGLVFKHNFPVDGEYLFRMTFYYTNVGGFYGSLAKDEKIEINVDGERMALLDVEPRKIPSTGDLRSQRVKVKAGPHNVAVTFLQKTEGPVDDFVSPYERSLTDVTVGDMQGFSSLPHMKNIAVSGPYNTAGVGDTPSRRKVFVCRPANATDEIPCAKKILSSVARQAYRRPVTDKDTEVLLSFYQNGRNKGDFEAGIQMGLQRILADPEFVTRFERVPDKVTPGSPYRISDLELASRLSYFIWSSVPDDQLITVASQNKLREPGMLEKQVRRMLADPKSEALATNFAGQWLYLRNLQYVEPDVNEYPNFDAHLDESMKRETELLFDSIMREDHNVLDLLNANYTYVNERLARHYGIADVYGEAFRRVALTDPNRFGLLGQASFLTVTSLANRTSPVGRGKWVLENLMGTPPPVPPPNVPALKENPDRTGSIKDRDASTAKVLSVREKMEQHRTQEPCHSCHQIMDPIGFSLENYDAVGQWRTADNGLTIDASGQLVDGTKIQGPAGLRQALMARSDAFVRTLTEKLLTYATGRRVEYYDMPVIRAIDRDAAKNSNHFSNIVLGIVKSAPFQMRASEENAGQPSKATPVASTQPGSKADGLLAKN
jgi:cytochrome c551/c552